MPILALMIFTRWNALGWQRSIIEQYRKQMGPNTKIAAQRCADSDKRGLGPGNFFSNLPRQERLMSPNSRKILPAPTTGTTLRRRWLGHRLYWLCQAVGWGGLFFIMVGTSLADKAKQGAFEKIIPNLAFVLCGVLTTHLLRITVLYARKHFTSWRQVLSFLTIWVLATSAGIHGALQGLMLVFAPGEFEKTENQGDIITYSSSIIFVSILIAAWVCFYLGYHYYRSYQASALDQLRLAGELKEAELRTMKAQLNPHFLFNSLNTLRSLIPEEQNRPREAVTLLADLLRAALTIDELKTISLAQELETVENYLALEKLRFEERLRVTWDIDQQTLAWPVPPFLLQTLVENAVKYGVSPNPQGAEIHISAKCTENTLSLRVGNPGQIRRVRGSTAVGLKNATARLKHLIGPESTLDLSQETPDKVVAEVVIRLQNTHPASS